MFNRSVVNDVFHFCISYVKTNPILYSWVNTYNLC